MKRTIGLALAVILLLTALASCGGTVSDTTPIPTTPAPTTPAPTTPAPTTPAPTTPAPTTPVVTTPCTSAPVQEPELYFTATLKKRVLTLAGKNSTFSLDFNELKQIAFRPAVPYGSSTIPDVVRYSLADNTSFLNRTVSWYDLDGILTELFGVSPNLKTTGPEIAIETITMQEYLRSVNTDDPAVRMEIHDTFYWNFGSGLQMVTVFEDGRFVLEIDGVLYRSVLTDPEEAFEYEGTCFGYGYAANLTILDRHLFWINPATEENELKAEINEVWLSTVHSPAQWFDEDNIVTRHYGLRLYGQCNGYSILFIAGGKVNTRGNSALKIDEGLVLDYATNCQLYAYKNRAIYTVKELYQNGMLSREDVTDILAYHEKFERQLMARDDYDNPFYIDGTDITIPEDSLSCDKQGHYDLGTYGGYQVHWSRPDTRGGDSWYIIGGYAFLTGGGAVISVKCGSMVYSLSYAFSRGYLTTEDMRVIAYRYKIAYNRNGAQKLYNYSEHTLPSAPLSDNEKANILRAWKYQLVETKYWYDENDPNTLGYGIRYQGNVGPAVILRGTSYGEIFAYCDGVLYKVGRDLVLSPDALASIDSYNRATYDAAYMSGKPNSPLDYDGEHPPLGQSPYTEEELEAWGIHPKGSYRSKNGYLGTYNGFSVYAEKDELVINPDNHRHNIGGVAFHLGQTYSASVCKDGEVYSLEQACRFGLLGYYDLRAIAYYWYGESYPAAS